MDDDVFVGGDGGERTFFGAEDVVLVVMVGHFGLSDVFCVLKLEK